MLSMLSYFKAYFQKYFDLEANPSSIYLLSFLFWSHSSYKFGYQWINTIYYR